MKITFYGGVRGVTGSKHLLEINRYHLLLECGLFQGRRKDTYERNLNFPFEPSQLDALIISHAHMDHLGNVPNLVKKGFGSDIHCTSATADLAPIMLYDSAKINEGDVAYVNKIKERRGEPPISPLYTSDDVSPIINLLHRHGYNQPFGVFAGVQATFFDAGHLLGSAITLLDIDEAGRRLSLCYTGDLGRKNLPIIRDPVELSGSDILIVESTYGNRLHADIKEAKARLASAINETVKGGGRVIIPSFALGRTQDLLYELCQLKVRGEIADIPVFVDSPLATNATEIFRKHMECFDEETRALCQTEDPFGFSRLHYIQTAEDSKKLNELQGPMIIIGGSGMAESGRILHHLKNNIGNSRNTVLIVGWQAENTLGRKIQEKWKSVPIFGEKYRLKARVEVFNEFSGHADKNDLIRWVSRGKWRRIFVVHGEEKASLSLAEALREKGYADVVVPEVGEGFTI